jgi:hypothetical protein
MKMHWLLYRFFQTEEEHRKRSAVISALERKPA